VAASRYTKLESLEVGCPEETLLWSIEEDSNLPDCIPFNRLLKLTLYGRVSACLVPPMIQAESLRHLCIDVVHGMPPDFVESNPLIWERSWSLPRFPNLRSCIIRVRWGFPIGLLRSFIEFHPNLIALELPLCYLWLARYQIPEVDETIIPNPPTRSLKLLRLRIKKSDLDYLSEDNECDIANYLGYLCHHAKGDFRIEILRPTKKYFYTPVWVERVLHRKPNRSILIHFGEEDTGIPAEDSWNRALLDGGENEEVLNLGRRDTTFDQ